MVGFRVILFEARNVKVDIFCSSENCGWSFSVDADQAVPGVWLCPKCGTQQRQAARAEEVSHDLKEFNPELSKRLGEDGWSLWPPQDRND